MGPVSDDTENVFGAYTLKKQDPISKRNGT
jgi:hypothetical protein